MIAEVCNGDTRGMAAAMGAINAVLGFSLLVMQGSFQTGKLAEELERFLSVSGMSRTLFNNLAAAYKV